jgi:hemerythrin
MSLIEWKDSFSVGVAAVDLEHRELIELINELHERIGEAADTDMTLAMLGEIYAQISAHFALEEKYMRESEYPRFPEHKEDHEELLDELRDIMDRVEDLGRYDADELSQELGRWFSEHFRTHDALLHAHANPR